MNKQERKAIKAWKEQNFPTDRGNTWIGFRPVVFKDGKYNKKVTRRNNKAMCKEGM